MEWGVAALPSADGRFPQIAGFRMRGYNQAAAGAGHQCNVTRRASECVS